MGLVAVLSLKGGVPHETATPVSLLLGLTPEEVTRRQRLKIRTVVEPCHRGSVVRDPALSAAPSASEKNAAGAVLQKEAMELRGGSHLFCFKKNNNNHKTEIENYFGRALVFLGTFHSKSIRPDVPRNPRVSFDVL